jgi:hypothetical protein
MSLYICKILSRKLMSRLPKIWDKTSPQTIHRRVKNEAFGLFDALRTRGARVLPAVKPIR